MKKMYSSFLLLICVLFTHLLVGQPYILVGSAKEIVAGTEYQITPDQFEQSGAVWSQTKLNLSYDFKIITQLNFGSGNTPGADGMAFVLQPLNVDQGGTGGQIGFGGIVPSFLVEFDTYQNSNSDQSVGNGDPLYSLDHIAFSRDGSDWHLLSNPAGPNPPAKYDIPYPSPYTFTTDPSTPTGVEFEDGQWHNAVFEWNATTKTFKVTFDNRAPVTLVYDLTNEIFAGNPEVFWGITGATGAEHNDQRIRIMPLAFSVVKTDIKCYGKNDGAVTLNVTGGIAPYSYTINGAASGPIAGSFNSLTTTISNLAPGGYTVVVADAAGATTLSKSFTISQPAAPLSASSSLPVHVKCFGESNGSVTISASGGTAPYVGVGLKENLSAGTHTFKVTDANGCEDEVLVTILEPTKLVASSKDKTPACNGSNGSVTITATGGTGNYTGTGVKSGLAPGNYTFVVTDANGCSSSIDVQIDGTGTGSFSVSPETFPNQFNTGFTKSLVNKTFVGSTGTWTANSNANATIAVLKPYYSPSTSYALKVVNFKTQGSYGTGSASATSPKQNITGACCPDGLTFNFTLWSYNCVSGDTKAALRIDFSSDNGTTWTEVWSKTSAELFSSYGANGKAGISIPIAIKYQTTSFRYRFRGEMATSDPNNFYTFIDDISIVSPAVCAPKGSIGDLAWKDTNGNGIQEVGELGLAGVMVKLTKPDGTIINQNTDAGGKYTFSDLPAGSYSVAFVTPAGFTPSPSKQGSNDAIDSDPVNGMVTIALAAGENKTSVDAGFKVPACTNTTQHTETYPNQFNTGLTKSLVNKTFAGSSGTWTANSNNCATVAVLKPYYSASTSYALKIVNFKTGSTAGKSSAASPKLNLSNPCCPDELKMKFTLWTYTCVAGDSKAALEIDFSKDNGSTWTEVWSKTSAQLNSSYGANGKATITIPVPVGYQNANFKYRFRGEMAAYDPNNFYVFIDDISITSPSTCNAAYVTSASATDDADVVEIADGDEVQVTEQKVADLTLADELAVKVSPNPTRSDFLLSLECNRYVPVTVRILDASGRQVKVLAVKANQSIRFGSEFKRGTYLIEVVQGDQRKIVKAIKL